MSNANSFHIDFPSKPTLIFREEGKVTFIDDKGNAAAICLSTQDMAPFEAAVVYQRRGLDDIRMFAGPVEKIAAAFHDFEARAGAAAAPSRQATFANLSPSHWLMAGTIIAISILAIGTAGYVATANRQGDPQSAARIEMLENLTKQIEQISGDPHRPAPGSSIEAPPLMPPTGPLKFTPAKVKRSGDMDLSPRPAPAVQGAMPVPKELPSLPQSASRTTIDVAALTDAETTKDTNASAKVSVTVDSEPAKPITPGTSPIDPQTQAATPGDHIDNKVSDGDKPADKTEGKVSPAGVPAMSPAQAQELLKTLEQIKTQATEGGELTPDLLKQLPMDVARRLVSTGIATVTPQERIERAQRMARIVRLPASIINNYRGKDGIASIPEQDTWVANKGRITIPLPGGGDILEPGILKEFGLQP